MVHICDYPQENRRDYLLLVAAVAASDRVLHPDELSLLEKWLVEFELNSDYHAEVLAAAKMAPDSLHEMQKRMADTDLTYSLMLDMMGMAMADGVLMDDERVMLRDMADFLEIDPIDFNILMEFVHSAYQASFLSSPEPLYEHNIDSAFQLLRGKQVRLFPHTLLCVTSSDFDRKLKERWFDYELPADPKGQPKGH